jgi:ectoine hydroxylase-related dioxygenase (phytanoyl-CoA dioxygenase family)
MTVDGSAHLLTEDERRRFEDDGYLVVPDALGLEDHQCLLDAVERVVARVARDRGSEPDDRMLVSDILALDPSFLDLIDWPRTFAKVWGILGWNIQLYHTNLCVAPPLRADGTYRQHYVQAHTPSLSRSTGRLPSEAAWQWHRDSGQVNEDLGPMPHPRLSVKVAYFLSDTLEPNDGNLFVVPGSHRDTSFVRPPSDPEGATPLLVPARSAVLFDRRLAHSSSPNTGVRTRRVLFYGYSYRWFRPRDDMTVGGLIETATPIRRQLLGAARGAYTYSSPAPEDVPLRALVESRAAGLAEPQPLGASA